MLARARTLDGDWEPAPHNPILTHRSQPHPGQNTGHADLFQLTEGTWGWCTWASALEVRRRAFTRTAERHSWPGSTGWTAGPLSTRHSSKCPRETTRSLRPSTRLSWIHGEFPLALAGTV
ncbi:hypothetical protein [Arthrobacter sp. Z1-15]